MLHIVVCDDEIIDRKLIKTMVERYMSSNLIDAEIALFGSGDEYLAAGDIEKADIVFLDIYMEGMDGVALARRIRGENKDCQIIFTTSSNEYAADAFEVEALSYLRKPVSEEKLKNVLDTVMVRRARTKAIEISCGRNQFRVYTSDIIYIETLGRRVSLHTANSEYVTYTAMSKMMEMLPEGEFVQVSRFEAVSLRHVSRIDVKEVRLDDGRVLQVSQKKADSLSESYDEFRRREQQ